MRSRRKMLLLGLPIYILALMMAGTALLGLLMSEDVGGFLHDVPGVVLEPGWWVGASIAACVVAGSQAVFLIPAFQFRRGRTGTGKPLAVSAVLLALVVAMMLVGLVSGLLELCGPWGSKGELFGGGSSSADLGDQSWFAPLFWTMLVVSWIAWSIVLVRFTRRAADREGRLGRLVGLLLGGTVIEAFAILPIDIMVRRRTSCYCNTGTFATLAFSIIAAIWLAGPGAYLALTSKRRRAWFESHCRECGYERGPSPGEKCPECGNDWE